jgi:hypothetical protein
MGEEKYHLFAIIINNNQLEIMTNEIPPSTIFSSLLHLSFAFGVTN